MKTLQLSPSDRTWLAERLLSSLDDDPAQSAEEIEAAWLKEADRRFEAYRRGEMTGQDARNAIAEILAERD